MRPCQGRSRGFKSRLPLQRLNGEGGGMRGERGTSCFIPHPSALVTILRRRSQVVRQRSAKPLFVGSIPTAALIESVRYGQLTSCPYLFVSLLYHSSESGQHAANALASGIFVLPSMACLPSQQKTPPIVVSKSCGRTKMS